MSSFRKSTELIVGAVNFLVSVTFALAMYIIGIVLLLIGSIVILVIAACVITFVFTPDCHADFWDSSFLIQATLSVVIAAGIGVAFTWGGTVTCKAANTVVRDKHNIILDEVSPSAANSLLRASSRSDAAVREELLRPAAENEIHQELLLRGSNR